MKGYFSVIQYCPDRSRLEAVNIGVLLFCPEARFLEAATTDRYSRVRKLFGREGFDKTHLDAARRALVNRLQLERESMTTLDELNHFIASRGNDIVLTPARAMRVDRPHEELKALFEELVATPRKTAQRVSRTVITREIERAFRKYDVLDRVKRQQTVEVPRIGVQLTVPFSYLNGAVNLIRPQAFSGDKEYALRTASELAVWDGLFRKYSSDDQVNHLIVVSDFTKEALASGVKDSVLGILDEYGTEVYDRNQIEELARKVEAEAHV